MSDWNSEDIQVVSSEEVFEHFVLADEESIIEYLKSDWLESALSQMVSARIRLGISQKILAENIGKSQPAIARLEKGNDIKLSVLWDYYAGLGLTPSRQIELENLYEVKAHLREAKTRKPLRTKPLKMIGYSRETRYTVVESSHWGPQKQGKSKSNITQLGRWNNSSGVVPTRYTTAI